MPETTYPPIASYALISDCNSAALVSIDGSVDWCCFDRFDSRPVFARILDWQRGGHFKIAPKAPHTTTRRYVPGTNVLETIHTTDAGVLVVTDALPVRESSEADDPEAVFPYHQLLRHIRCDSGVVEVLVEFAPRFDYGLTTPEMRVVTPHLATACGGADALIIQSELPMIPTSPTELVCNWALGAAQEAFVSVTYAPPHRLRARELSHDELSLRLEFTKRFWIKWSERCTYEGPYREQVLRSALVLKALTHASTGAIVAAPTTSLPEAIGGPRNWDYRYTWLRDASFTLDALFGLGYTEEADAFMRWLRRTTPVEATDLQIVYGVEGERLLPEFEIRGIDGYRSSRPVRVGNDAANQFQLDIYGELLNTAWLHFSHGGTIDREFWGFLTRVAQHVESVWTLPDEGIWEVRGGRRHFVHSKVMAWVAIDRAIKLAERLGNEEHVARWRDVREWIRAKVERDGVDPGSGAFVQAFGSPELDASSLLITLVGFLPATDPRIRATVERIELELGTNGLVHRYRNRQDHLAGGEATFAICSFWLVDNLVHTGQVAKARDLFERLLKYANDVGLLAEMIDIDTGAQLGNFPQAFSHIGLINSALLLSGD